jgi:hypothetical protein
MKLIAVNAEMKNPIITDIMRAGPATPAAIPITTNMPAPIIAFTPIEKASNNPSDRCSFVGVVVSTSPDQLGVHVAIYFSDIYNIKGFIL